MQSQQDNTTQAIRQLNDQLRTTLTGGRLMLTRGVQEQGDKGVRELLILLCRYDQFSPDNDPYSEHDFGAIDYEGRKYFFKIDYYDLDYRMHSPDATDANVTRRVLTLMLAEEY